MTGMAWCKAGSYLKPNKWCVSRWDARDFKSINKWLFTFWIWKSLFLDMDILYTIM